MKSAPAMKLLCSFAFYTIAVWNVFYGDPFRYTTYSSIAANAYNTLPYRLSSLSIILSNYYVFSISGTLSSVLAVHNTITVSTYYLNILISSLILSNFY